MPYCRGSAFTFDGRWRRLLVLATVVAGLSAAGPVGCSGGSEKDEKCQAGERGCECRNGEMCAPGLSCVDETCIASSTDAGSTDGGSDTAVDTSVSEDTKPASDTEYDTTDTTSDAARDTTTGGESSRSATIGPSGGELSVGAARLEVPEGALEAQTELTVTETTGSVPSGYDGYSSFYEFQPAGLEFNEPVEVSIPFEGDAEKAALFWSRPGDEQGYDQLPGIVEEGTITARVDHFSTGFVADGVDDPNPVAAVKVATGFRFSCALLESGGVRCWGDGTDGQLGDGQKGEGYKPTTPVAVEGISAAIDISAGDSHACMLRLDGEVRCWGNGSTGQLGNDDSSASATPVAPDGLSKAVDISAGWKHTCAVLESGEVRCWGGGQNGRLGNGSTTYSLTPVAVSGLSTATEVSAGWQHSCAVVGGGSIRCWGSGGDGQLGNGRTREKTTPVEVYKTSAATHVAAGDRHTCGLLADGHVECWGYAADGRLGDGSETGEHTPVDVAELSPQVTNLSAGLKHTCVTIANGEARCWGDGGRGRLGHGSEETALTPVKPEGLSTVIDISAGHDHTCAALENGEVWCWGYGEGVQFGSDSEKFYTATPKNIPLE